MSRDPKEPTPFPEDEQYSQMELFKVRNGALIFDESVKYEDWAKITGRFLETSRDFLFLLGDALVFGHDKFGEQFSQVLDATKYDVKTLANAMRVCEKLPKGRRQPTLTFGHHASVVGLPE